jgi:hypothetical protein
MGNVESRFQSEVIKDLTKMFPGSFIRKNNANDNQGIPDLLILFGKHWGMLEVKASEKAPARPNQPYYVEKFNEMSFAAFISPETKDTVLHALRLAFRADREACVP